MLLKLISFSILLIFTGCATTGQPNIADGYLEKRKAIATEFEVNVINELNKVKALKNESEMKIINVNKDLEIQPVSKYQKYNPFDPQVSRLGY